MNHDLFPICISCPCVLFNIKWRLRPSTHLYKYHIKHRIKINILCINHNIRTVVFTVNVRQKPEEEIQNGQSRDNPE